MSRTRVILLLTPLALALLILLALAAVGILALTERLANPTGTLLTLSPAAAAARSTAAGPTVPPDFSLSVYARSLATSPSALLFAPDGALVVLTLEGQLYRCEDSDGDGSAETPTLIYANADGALRHAVGLAFFDGKAYISHSSRISTLEDTDGDGVYDRLTTLVEGLPSLLFADHSNNGIAFGPDDKLYIGVGAVTDHGPLSDNPFEAAILRMNPDGSRLEVYAAGFRNPYDLTFSPDGDLFTADTSPSALSPALPYLPPEEINHVRKGRRYGFPTHYGSPPPGLAYPDSQPPVADLYAAAGSAGLVYYAAEVFPPAYRGGLFLAQRGSEAPLSSGRGVIFVRLTPTMDGSYSGEWEVFADFANTPEALRPVDVTVGPDGALYILEQNTAAVYRVGYEGGPAPEAVTEAAPLPTSTPASKPVYAPALVAQGEALYRAEVAPPCITCHLLDGSAGIGPSLLGLYQVAGARVAGLSAEEYVRQSIINPNAFVVPGYNANYMYQQYADALTDEQINALVAYVLTLDKP